MSSSLRVVFYGAGQVASGAAEILRRREGVEVLGTFRRDQRDTALRSGADVVVVATTSFLASVADDIRDAVEAGSNVICTAEEAAAPWANDAVTADRLDALARSRGVTIVGCGVNPGLAFDALVLTACGAVAEVESLLVERVVDISGFGETVLRRIGVGHTPEQFEQGRRDGTVTGHIGFPQSMRVVASGLGVQIANIERELDPIFAETELPASSLTVAPGQSAGFRQRYAATLADGRLWFEALFTGHVDPPLIGLQPRDAITVRGPFGGINLAVNPGIQPQSGSASMVANSVRRVAAAAPGWLTVAELPPAVPC